MKESFYSGKYIFRIQVTSVFYLINVRNTIIIIFNKYIEIGFN